MSSDYGKELLRSGIIEAKAGNRDSARRYFDRAVYMSNDHDELAEAWFWMSQVIDETVEKRKALENCLAHDLGHVRARRALAILDGKLKVAEIINPDQAPRAPEGSHTTNTERFMCPKCGGRMSFAPDGQSLTCEYCSRNQKFSIAQPGTANEKDFIIAMATARGQGKPLNQQVFHCEGCGCEIILPPNQISAACVYCGSPHVVNWESEEELLAPDGIIPHAFDGQGALKHLIEWMESNKIKPENVGAGRRPELVEGSSRPYLPRGVYLPLWSFDLGGEITYTGEVHEEELNIFGKTQTKVRPVSGSYPVQINDLPIPASRKLSAVFLRLIPTFDLKAVKPYEPGYLANWPAEVYDIPMAEASLDARAQSLSRFKRDLPNLSTSWHTLHITTIASANMTVESFRLNLLPVWMTELPFDTPSGRRHLVLINGMNGTVKSDLPEKSKESRGLMEWLGDLLED